MSNATAARSAPSMAASERRLAAGVLASLLLHALVLSLQFGIPGLRPGAGGPVTIRLAPAPSLRPVPAVPDVAPVVPVAPVPGAAASVPSALPVAPVQSGRDATPGAPVLPPPVLVPAWPTPSESPAHARLQAAQPGFTLVDPVAPVPVPVPQRGPVAPPRRRVVRHRRKVPTTHVADSLHTRVIAQDGHRNDSFEVPLPVVESEPDPAPLALIEPPADDDVVAAEAARNEQARLAEAREREQAMKRAADDARLRAEAEQTLQAEAAQQRRRLAAQMARHDDELAARQRDADAARASADRRVADEEARQLAEQQRVQQAELEHARRMADEQRLQQAEQQRLQQVEQVRAQRLAEQERLTQVEQAHAQALLEQQRLQQAEQVRAQQLAEQQRMEQVEQDRRRQWVEQARLKQAERELAQQLAEQQRMEQTEREQAQRLEAQRLQQAEQQRLQLAEQERAQQLADQRRAEETRRQLAEERLRQERAQQAEQAARHEAEEHARLAQEQVRRQGNGDAPGAAPGPARGIADDIGGAGTGPRGDTLPRAVPGSDLASRAREMMRGIDILKPVPQAMRPAEDAARRAPAEAGRRDIPLRMYADSVRQKIERNAVLSDVQLSADVVRTDPIVSVAIRSDGSVAEVTIVRSSGRTDIDEFVRRIVHLNARYSAFPPNVAARYDVIELRRVWRFAGALRLLEEMR